MIELDPKQFLASLFTAAVEAADPYRIVAANLPPMPKGRTILVGAGKGVAHFARAFDQAWDGPLHGTVVTRYGYAVPCPRINVLEAAHPLPDMAGLRAARELVSLVSGLTKDDLVVCLVTGGGSSLLPAPPQGLSLEDEIELNETLLYSGVPISAMNVLRKAVSTIKGGRLALAAYPAKVLTLVVSDVPGDDPSMVSSGPTIANAFTREDALAVVDTYRLALSDRVRSHLGSVQASAPDPLDPRFARCETRLVASACLSLENAAKTARENGIETVILSDAIEGDARVVGQVHASIAREVVLRDRPFRKPILLLSGGETTVSFDGSKRGRGGRNSTFLLSFAFGIRDLGRIDALAADTDGIDGSESNAGAFADCTSVSRMMSAGIDPGARFAENDSWAAFNAVGDLFIPGPTSTNVNDLRAILIRS